jgi:hypothetical protein
MPHSETLRDRAGDVGGLALGPFAGALSALRGGRVLHPAGIVLTGEAEAIGTDDELRDIGARLAGPVLVRLSGAWWKQREWKDVLGCALRFRSHDPAGVEPEPGDQDLLLATIRHVVTLPFAPLTTEQHDFLANDYYGITPFRAPPLERVWFRLRALGSSAGEGTRAERLVHRLQEGPVPLELELKRPRAAYQPLLRLDLLRPIEVNERALRFDPFRTGRQIFPQGYIHHLRRFTYPASQSYRAWRNAR